LRNFGEKWIRWRLNQEEIEGIQRKELISRLFLSENSDFFPILGFFLARAG